MGKGQSKTKGVHMDNKCINNKIEYIYDQFIEILLMQIRSLYEEYDENYLDEFELKWRKDYKLIIDKNIKERELAKIISEFLLIEPDEYGLDMRENDVKFIISDVFRNIGIDLSSEFMLVKDDWKEKQVSIFKEDISRLTEKIEESKYLISDLSKSLDKQTNENKSLNIQIQDISNKLNTAKNNFKKHESILENYDNQLSKNNSEILEYKKQLNESKQKSSILENKLQESKEEAMRFKKEIEHLKKGIEMLKYQNNEKENYKKLIINENEEMKKEIDKISNENKELKLYIDSTIDKLKISNKDLKENEENMLEYKNRLNESEKKSLELENILSKYKIQNEGLKKDINLIDNEKEKIYIENKNIKNILQSKESQIKRLQNQINSLSNFNEIKDLDMHEASERYKEIYGGIRTNLKRLASDKEDIIVYGKDLKQIATQINKLAVQLKGITDKEQFKSSINNLIGELSQLEKIFNQNGKSTEMISYIEELNNLKKSFK